MIAIMKFLPNNMLASPKDIEVLKISIGIRKPLTLCIVYLPPYSSSNYPQTLINYLQDLVQGASPVIILGDFNTLDISWSTLRGRPSQRPFVILLFTQLTPNPHY